MAPSVTPGGLSPLGGLTMMLLNSLGEDHYRYDLKLTFFELMVIIALLAQVPDEIVGVTSETLQWYKDFNDQLDKKFGE